MKSEYEFSTMVNNNHHKVKKAQEVVIPTNYTDHEIRMACLQRKAKNDQKKANREAVKFGLMMVVAMPSFWICFRLMIALMWAYSYAVRGF